MPTAAPLWTTAISTDDQSAGTQLRLQARLRVANFRRKAVARRLADKEISLQRAHDQLHRIKLKLDLLKRDDRFAQLMSLTSDERVAYHIWIACLCEGALTCGLHIDDKDAGHLLNFVVSLGLDINGKIHHPLPSPPPTPPLHTAHHSLLHSLTCCPVAHPVPAGAVVPLCGCLLMVVLAFSDTPLFTAASVSFDSPHAFDQCGNVVFFEPASMELSLPDGCKHTDSPKTEQVVRERMGEGKCVVAFFRSGGFIAAQLGHHWHAVVCKQMLGCTSTCTPSVSLSCELSLLLSCLLAELTTRHCLADAL
jgi:hypothetical protein